MEHRDRAAGLKKDDLVDRLTKAGVTFPAKATKEELAELYRNHVPSAYHAPGGYVAPNAKAAAPSGHVAPNSKAATPAAAAKQPAPRPSAEKLGHSPPEASAAHLPTRTPAPRAAKAGVANRAGPATAPRQEQVVNNAGDPVVVSPVSAPAFAAELKIVRPATPTKRLFEDISETPIEEEDAQVDVEEFEAPVALLQQPLVADSPAPLREAFEVHYPSPSVAESAAKEIDEPLASFEFEEEIKPQVVQAHFVRAAPATPIVAPVSRPQEPSIAEHRPQIIKPIVFHVSPAPELRKRTVNKEMSQSLPANEDNLKSQASFVSAALAKSYPRRKNTSIWSVFVRFTFVLLGLYSALTFIVPNLPGCVSTRTFCDSANCLPCPAGGMCSAGRLAGCDTLEIASDGRACVKPESTQTILEKLTDAHSLRLRLLRDVYECGMAKFNSLTAPVPAASAQEEMLETKTVDQVTQESVVTTETLEVSEISAAAAAVAQQVETVSESVEV